MKLGQTPKIEVLICAYNNSIGNVLNNLPQPIEGVAFLISHQISDKSLSGDYVDQLARLATRHDIKVVTTFSTGLSNNRNNALKNSSGELLLITDDDVAYESGWANKILQAFNKYPNADIITFRVKTPEGEPFKVYYPGGVSHTKFSLFRVSSIEVVIRRSSVFQSGVLFDPNFGLNTKFRACEETVFLSDLQNHGLKLITSDQVIAIHPKESSGGNYSNIGSCIVRGAVIRRVFGLLGLPLVFAYSFKHYSSYKANHSLVSFLFLAIRGFFSRDAVINKL